jgi:HEAT repeat protein
LRLGDALWYRVASRPRGFAPEVPEMRRSHVLVPHALAVGVLLAAAPAPAKPAKGAPAKAEKAPADGLPTAKEVTDQARAAFTELAGTSDPLVRRALFDGRVLLGGDDRAKAIAEALKDGDWTLHRQALVMALADKDAKLHKAALDQVAALIASGEANERTRGYDLIKSSVGAADALALYKKAAVDGGPDARAAARAAQIALGGKTAWAIIEAGLKEGPEEREHKEAVETLRHFKGPEGVDWALAHLHDADDMGGIARDLLVAVDDAKAVARIEKTLDKMYDETAADFPKRVDAASVLARRGKPDKVTRTLLAGTRFQEPATRLTAWQGIVGVRDLEVLGKQRETILSDEEPAEADAAYAWMEAWAKDRAEPKVFEILQEAARGDHRPLRMRAMAALTRLAHRPSAPLFEAAMSEGQTEVRLAGAQGLAAVAKAGDEARIAQFLQREPDVEVKKALVGALAHIGTAAIIDPLQFVITAPQSEIKLAAMDAVAATGQPKAAVLIRLLERDPDVDVRFRAFQHLLKLDPQPTMAKVSGVLPWLTPSHVEALAADDKTPLDLLAKIAQDGDDNQRGFAVDGLARHGADAATRLLTLIERGKPDTAAAALVALADQRKADSIATYRAAAASTEGMVRASAFRAMGLYGGKQLLELIVPALTDKDPLARARAAEAAVRLVTRKDA